MAIQLVVENLNATIDGKPVLRNVTVTAQPGHILAMMGKAGSGKSTFLRSVNRMAEQYGAVVSGHIIVDHTSIFMQEISELRRQVGMVFTEPVLFAGSVMQNITMGFRLQGVLQRKKLEKVAEETLYRMDIFEEYRDLLHKDASTLSRSQAQVVCIARALALKPGLLLLDEPTRLLDIQTSMKVEEMLFSLKKECTMVIAVHTPQMAGRLAEETALMEEGTILEWGRTSDLFYHPKHLHTEQYISAKFS